MILFLCLSAHATDVELPVKVVYSEYTGWGEDPAVVDAVVSASVAVTNPTTGKVFTTRGELLTTEKLGAGSGEISFSADTAGTLHTWAVYLLDADGELLSAKPEVIDVLFGDGGDGTITAREAQSFVRDIRLGRQEKRGEKEDLRVVVQGTGTNAAYIGIQELAADGAPLNPHVDMEAMTAGVYATYQGLMLDTIVPLDRWKSSLSGTITVEGVAASGRTIESGTKMDYDVTFYGPAVKDGDSTLAAIRIPNFVAMQYRSKREPPSPLVIPGHPVVLNSDDQVFESYDGAMNVVIEGDATGLEIAARLTATGDAVKPTSDVLLSFDPSDIAISASATVTAKFPGKPEDEGQRMLSLQPLDKEGKPLADWLDCTLTPTALTVKKSSSTLRYVGECLRDDDGRAYVRGVNFVVKSTGTATLSAEMLGLDYQGAAKMAFDVDGFGLYSAPVAVSLTSFSLNWSFPEDIDDGSYELEILYYGATEAPDSTIVGDGWYAWSATEDSVWDSGKDETGPYQREVSKEEAEAIKAQLVEAGATVEIK